jgi:hypothetical protein
MVQLIAGFIALAWMQGVGMYLLGTLLLGLGFCFCGRSRRSMPSAMPSRGAGRARSASISPRAISAR